MARSGEAFGYEKLEVWRRAMNLVDSIYALTKGFPKDEAYGLASQMRRAAVSIPSNIAEGHGRGSKYFANSLRQATGSLFELRTQIEIAARQKYISDDDSQTIQAEAVEISRMLDGLHRKIASD